MDRRGGDPELEATSQLDRVLGPVDRLHGGGCQGGHGAVLAWRSAPLEPDPAEMVQGGPKVAVRRLDLRTGRQRGVHRAAQKAGCPRHVVRGLALTDTKGVGQRMAERVRLQLPRHHVTPQRADEARRVGPRRVVGSGQSVVDDAGLSVHHEDVPAVEVAVAEGIGRVGRSAGPSPGPRLEIRERVGPVDIAKPPGGRGGVEPARLYRLCVALPPGALENPPNTDGEIAATAVLRWERVRDDAHDVDRCFVRHIHEQRVSTDVHRGGDQLDPMSHELRVFVLVPAHIQPARVAPPVKVEHELVRAARYDTLAAYGRGRPPAL